MGTLTANDTRLPGQCEHKLPTSCRLSSIPGCCACADERAHAASYSTYIDGIGFVPRGNRWQRYCWFCKEFWEHRVRVSGLRPGQTRIPEVPDQTEFLERWYEFHRGYRIVAKEDGTEERVAVLGEDFRDVSPGYLPRTLEELRAGRRQEEETRQVQQETPAEQEQTGPSLEETLDQLFVDASAEEAAASSASTATPSANASRPTQEPPVRHNNIHAQAMNPAGSRSRDYQVRRVAALRRELNRMRNGIERVISGLRDLGEEVPNYTETTGRLTALGDTLDTISGEPSRERIGQSTNGVDTSAGSAGAAPQSDHTLANIQTRVDEARSQMNEAQRVRDQTASELDVAESEFRSSQQRLQQLQREQRTTENYMRLFGTREEMLEQGENYESPIGGMFTRAYERFNQAEQVRQETRTLRQLLEDEEMEGGEAEARRLAELESRERDVWGVPRPRRRRPPPSRHVGGLNHAASAISPTGTTLEREPERPTPPELTTTGDEAMLEEYYALLRQQDQDPAMSGEARDVSAFMTRAGLPRQPVADFQARSLQRERDLDDPPDDDEESETARPEFSMDEWWRQDVEHIIHSLIRDDELRSEVEVESEDASLLLNYLNHSIVPDIDRTNRIEGLRCNSKVIWRTGLPTMWLQRRREQVGEDAGVDDLFFDSGNSGLNMPPFANHHNPYLEKEIMAQAYQMSDQVRQRADWLSPPERLHMLYRLQADQRCDHDVEVLQTMCRNEDALNLAKSVYSSAVFAEEDEDEPRRQTMEDIRRIMARQGDNSRNELESRRRDVAQNLALAAGRQAMQTGSQGVFEQMADRNEGTRAAFRRLAANDYLGRPPLPTLYRQLTLSDYLDDASTDSDSENDEDAEPRGLDARDSGRPEPKADEELKVSMECKICYTQISEVACLPCGHLVMCRWCSDQHSPCLAHDHTRPRRAAHCPVCRKGIRQKVKVFRA